MSEIRSMTPTNTDTETDYKALFDKGLAFHVQHNEEFCTNGEKHDWQGWREFEPNEYGAGGGETVCARCGLGAMSHSLRYGI